MNKKYISITLMCIAMSIIFGIISKDLLIGGTILATGLLCAYFASEGKRINYILGLINYILMGYVAFNNNLFGIFFFYLFVFSPLQIHGYISWKKNLDDDKNVKVREFNIKNSIIITLSCTIFSFILGYLLSLIPGQRLAFMDATSNCINLCGVILMILRFKESWWLWLIKVLIEHPEICFEVLQINTENIKYIPMNVREALPQICIEAVKQNPENIMHIPENVQIEYPQLCMDAVKKAKGILYYISIDVLESNPEICLEALLKDSECYEDIPEEIIEEHPELQTMQQIIDDYTYVEQIPKEELRQFPQIYLKSLQEKIKNEKGTRLENIIDMDLIVNNPNLVERCFEQFNMNYKTVSKLIVATKDMDFIKRILREKKEKISLHTLIEELGDSASLVEDLIIHKDEYSFTNNELAEIVLRKNDIKYAVDFFNNNIWQEDIETSLIRLPKGMTIGVEIESEGTASEQILGLTELIKDWRIHHDGSLGGEWNYSEEEYESGVEIVSPVLKAEEKNEKSIYKVCNFLNWTGQSISENCGGHIHVGADYLKDIDAWKNLIEIWSNTEKILYVIANKAGEPPREGIFSYAKPFRDALQQAIDEGEIELDSEEDINIFCEKLKDVQSPIFKNSSLIDIIQELKNPDARYSSINFTNIGDERKNTIEFRLSNGTLDPQTWIENINLFGGIVAVAQEISDIQHKLTLGQELNEHEINKLDNYETLKTQISEEERLIALLELTIPKEQQNIYLNRYRINSSRNQMYYFDKSNTLKPISIGRKKIGKLAFTGDEQITGEEYAQTVQIIRSELQQENNIEKVGE